MRRTFARRDNEQPRRPDNVLQQEPIKYEDVFDVSSGHLASKPITPQDAAAMQAAENVTLGHCQKGGPAAVMQSAASHNARFAGVSPDDVTDVIRDPGISISQTNIDGRPLIVEAIGPDVVGTYVREDNTRVRRERSPMGPPQGVVSDKITIGEALEATAISAGDKPVDQSDAAAIQAAEARATGLGEILPGGIGAEAQRAATRNARITKDEFKTKLGDVLTDAKEKLVNDKGVTLEDAVGVVGAEARNKEGHTTRPGGVAATVAAAAALNQETAFNVTV
ncbi:unnamed protein product [Cuscuta campestris]|uniref:SMP domain-containing protein n=1 Tax=Cuscuta campestris TaxID=132261 RepID=A0A484MDZ8_9ASTE|nr:unnamed protein product [Cuscuta campestris]